MFSVHTVTRVLAGAPLAFDLACVMSVGHGIGVRLRTREANTPQPVERGENTWKL